MLQPEFNLDEPTVSQADDAHVWVEVPQVLFDAWPERKQIAYCARRDYDAAAEALTAHEAQFYLTRADRYKEKLDAHTSQP